MKNDDFIPFGRPNLDASEIEAVTKVLSGPILVHGSVTKAFEEAFADRVGARHAISVASCTAGLHLSLLVQDVGPGDQVIVPAMTHVATAHAVEHCGARPVFVDVEDDSGNLDPDELVSLANDKIAAIMVVHYLGLPVDMDPVMTIADEMGAFVVEDCALAVDAKYDGRCAGTLGLTGCFSFYPVKHMTTVEGGMVVTNDDSIAAKIAQRKAFGYDKTIGNRKEPGIYDVTALGYKYRMNEVEAAVGLAQLDKLDAFQRARAENYRRLKAALADIEEITVFEPRKGKAVSSHYCLNAILPADGSIERATLVRALKETGVGSSVHYPCPVPLMSYYREKYGYSEGQFPVAEWLADQTVSLPVGPHLREGDPERIAAAFKDAVFSARSRASISKKHSTLNATKR